MSQLDKVQITIPYSPAILCKYHPLSRASWPQYPEIDPETKRQENAYLYFFPDFLHYETDPDIEKLIENEIREDESKNNTGYRNMSYFTFDTHFAFGVESSFNLLVIIQKFISNDLEFYIDSTVLHNSIDELKQQDRSVFDWAHEAVKNLRNLLYIRDLHTGQVKINIQVNEIIKLRNGQLEEGNKDHEKSVQYSYNDVSKNEIIDAAIKSTIQEINMIASTGNSYLDHIFWEPITEKITHDEIQLFLEDLESNILHTNPRTNKMNRFRGHLVSIIYQFMEQEGTDKDLNASEKAAIAFDLLAVFGLIDIERRISHLDNKSKSDYIKGLPKEGFLEITPTEEYTGNLAFLNPILKDLNRKKHNPDKKQ